jgi:Zn-dependent peptidase ImmA (M78 family)
MRLGLLKRCTEVARNLAPLYQLKHSPFASPELLDKFDIYQVRERLLDRDARLILQDGRAIIEVNSLFSEERHRFSVAHEIGHIILNECVGRDRFTVSHGDPAEESCCDRVAEILVATKELVRSPVALRQIRMGMIT